MKKMSPKFFSNVVVNTVLVCLLVTVFCAGFAFNKLSSVFDENDNGAIYHGNKQQPYVSVMINVYWGTEFLDEMLDVLKNENVKATFFVGGCWVAKNEDAFLKIVMDGHEIGNHGYFHKNHAKLDYEGNYNEIAVTHKLVKELAGIEMSLFAPPSGSFDNTVLKVAGELNYQTILWSKDTVDWRDKDENTVFVRGTKNLKNGDLVLMHPTQHTVRALKRMLTFYKQNEFKVVTVSDNIAVEPSILK